MEDYNSVPEFVPITVTKDDAENVAAKLSGSSGLNDFDSSALQNMLQIGLRIVSLLGVPTTHL